VHAAFKTTPLGEGNAIGEEKRHPPVGQEVYDPVFFEVKHMQCPGCRQAICTLAKRTHGARFPQPLGLIYPRRSTRPPAPSEVPSDLARDFNEAWLVLSDSPQSSAALSRRCLQSLLALQGYTQHKLAGAIDAVLASKTLRSDLADDLDSIRNIGNFAAHPLKDTNSGAILPVEPHEAQWNLEVLEGLFDFYYVAPARSKAKRDALNAKLQAGGQNPMKQP
jgi:hypothetical protein